VEHYAGIDVSLNLSSMWVAEDRGGMPKVRATPSGCLTCYWSVHADHARSYSSRCPTITCGPMNVEPGLPDSDGAPPRDPRGGWEHVQVRAPTSLTHFVAARPPLGHREGVAQRAIALMATPTTIIASPTDCPLETGSPKSSTAARGTMTKLSAMNG